MLYHTSYEDNVKWDGGFNNCADRIIEEFELRFNALNVNR